MRPFSSALIRYLLSHYQHGKYPQAVDGSLEGIPLIASPANALLGEIDFPRLLANSGNEPQQKRQPRADPAKEVYHLVRSHHAKYSFQPHAQRCKPQADHQTVDEAFYRQVVADEVLSQHCDTEMVVGTVVQYEYQNQRQQAQVEDHRPLTAALDAVGKGTDIGDSQKRRMLETHGSVDGGGEEDEIHRRMAGFKPHRCPPSYRIAASPAPAFPAARGRTAPWSEPCRRPD